MAGARIRGTMPGEDQDRDASVEDELRTIGFRLRELQRLLSMRVAQENRRLEAEGLDPVTEPPMAEED